MERCQGLPEGPCPNSRCDTSVRFTIYDLFLCRECELKRNVVKSTSVMATLPAAHSILSQGDTSSLKKKNVKKTNERATVQQTDHLPKLSRSGTDQMTLSDGDVASRASSSDSSGGADHRIVTSGDTGGKASKKTSVSRSVPNSSDPSSAVVQLSVASTFASRIAGVQKVILNELLAYVNVYRHNSTNEALQKVVLLHFLHEDVAEAKRLLVLELHSVDGLSQFTTERRNSSARPAYEAEVEDIIGILDIADTKQAVDGFLFVANNLSVMPKYGPEEINLAVVVDRQVRMDKAITSLSVSVDKLASCPAHSDSPSVVQQAVQAVASDLHQQLCAFSDTVSQRLDHLNAVCAQLSVSAAAAPPRPVLNASPYAAPPSRDVVIDRSRNLLLFGVAEDKDAAIWRQKVDQALQFVVGKSVDVSDMFRVGRFSQSKVRPIIVKLRTTWDKRLILSKCSILKEFGEPLFIAADEPLEIRRKNMLARIKSRAERDGKVVSVIDGVLSVDNVAVFSLKDGKLNNHV